MVVRLILILLLLSSLALLALWRDSSQPAAIRLAQTMTGEQWYAIRLHDLRVGYFAAQAKFLPDGNWQYRSHTHVLMNAGAPLNITKTLTFDRRPPHSLIRAHQETRQGRTQPEWVSIELTEDADALIASGSAIPTQALSWTYSLSDYLTVEAWVIGDNPEESIRAPTLDLNRLASIPRRYKLVEKRSDQITVSYEAPSGTSTITLDAQLVPVHIRAANLFEFTRATFAEAMAPVDPAFRNEYKLKLDQALVSPEDLERVELTFAERNFEMTGTFPAEVIGADREASRRPTTDYPANAPAFIDIAERTVNGASPTPSAIAALTAYVHGALRYRPNQAKVSVTEALRRGFGECTEFADLFTTVARAAGWSAQTVYGLAYDRQQPVGFALHAWNEVLTEDGWQAVDPTWNQPEADATHIPLSSEQLARIKYWQSQQPVQLEVKEATYRQL